MQSYDRLLIGGKWDAPATLSVLQVISPLTEEVIAQIPDCSTRDIDRAVAAARASQDHGPWPHMPVAERIGILRKLAAGLRACAIRGSRLTLLAYLSHSGQNDCGVSRLLPRSRLDLPVRGGSPRTF